MGNHRTYQSARIAKGFSWYQYVGLGFKSLVKIKIIPPNALQYTAKFYRCRACRRIYRQGSHIRRFFEFLDRVVS
ncbi:MAG TPA: hypothetical protein ENH29_07700 [Bacteroidetes bacterium]|nr:hypothetical protein [Bacteroidota bacterium]